MFEYNFVPDYAVWWKKRNLSKEQLCWLALGINPDDIKKSTDLGGKNNIIHEELIWRGQFGNYIDTLPNFLRIGDAHAWLMKDVERGKNNSEFVKNLYNFAHEFPKSFSNFLKSLKTCPIPDTYDAYQDYSQFSLSVKNSNEIKDEISGFSCLLGLGAEGFKRFCAIEKRIKNDGLSYTDLTPDERHFIKAYRGFLATEYPGPRSFAGSILYSAWKDVTWLTLWNGNFPDYVQSIHDAGYIFKPETYEFLKKLGIEPVYKAEGWAIKFYQRWASYGVWRLKDAARLYLGADPNGGREFQGFSCFKVTKEGFQLNDAEHIYWLDCEGNITEMPVGRLQQDSSLKNFVEGHVLAGNVTSVGKDNEGELLFKPRDIVEFFRDYCPNTYQPIALFQALGMKTERGIPRVLVAKDKTALKRKLVELMTGDSIPEHPKDWYRKEYANNVSQRGFLMAWASAIEETNNQNWSKPGRKK